MLYLIKQYQRTIDSQTPRLPLLHTKRVSILDWYLKATSELAREELSWSSKMNILSYSTVTQ